MKRWASPIPMLACLVAACGEPENRGNTVDAISDAGATMDSGFVDAGTDAGWLSRCFGDGSVTSSLSVALSGSVTPVDKVDLLFVIDNSGSMAQEQEKLAQQLPRMLRSLVSGVREDGSTFPPVSDLHVGVVTTDMGTSGGGIDLKPSCSGRGDDGRLQRTSQGSNCTAHVPAGYLSFVPSELALPDAGPLADAGPLDDGGTPTDPISAFTCLANVGTSGCGFEQQLEAMYKAVAPRRVDFLGDSGGHADAANVGFLRRDALLAIIHVSDEDDCSVNEAGLVLFDESTTHPGATDPASGKPLGLNVRCSYRDSPGDSSSRAETGGLLYAPERYTLELRQAVKPHSPGLVMFAAIVGIPEDIQQTPATTILSDPRMAFAVDPHGYSQDVTNINSAARDACRRCATLSESECMAQPIVVENDAGDPYPNPEIITGAKPAMRFVKVADAFERNGLLRSICADTYAPAINAIVDKISAGLGSTCLRRGLETNTNGLVDCDLVEFQPEGATEAACDGAQGRTFKGYERLPGSPQLRAVCSVNQLRVTANHELAVSPQTPEGVDPLVGWYYDAFSEQVAGSCPSTRPQRVSFHPKSAEASGTMLRLDCRASALFSSETGCPSGDGPDLGGMLF